MAGTNARKRKQRWSRLGVALVLVALLNCPTMNLPTATIGHGAAEAADFIEPFEGQGTIDAQYDDKIVIGDSLYQLSGLVRYYKDHTMMETTGRYHFKVGVQVGFLVNREGKVEVLFLDR